MVIFKLTQKQYFELLVAESYNLVKAITELDGVIYKPKVLILGLYHLPNLKIAAIVEFESAENALLFCLKYGIQPNT